ncbi:syncoilin-like isoform X3 [Electrophorus electricus]|uniref:syncoilin-like isoform X3 n=1 Tax=Electrophorus electricus TaxID=8005 RepID=UPI0015D091AB|nr:syncoilin-like isoform X3 [Electrophorus electricus]
MCAGFSRTVSFDPRSQFQMSSSAIKVEVMSKKGENHTEMDKDEKGCEDMLSESRCAKEEQCERPWVEGEESERRCLMLPGGVDSQRSLTGEEEHYGGSFWTGEHGEEPAEQREALAGRPAQDSSLGDSGDLMQWCVGEEVACAFEACIEEVGRLQRQQEELVQELLAEEEVLVQAGGALRPLLERAHGDLAHTHLHKHRLQEEVAQVKKQLFATVRECVQNQVTLAAQQYEVAQLALVQEELRAEVSGHLRELERLREEHQRRLAALVERVQGFRRPRAMSDLSQCRRATAELTRRTWVSMANLNDWYEPRLLALLRRKQAAEGTLRKTREFGQSLKSHVRPLSQETQRLELERARLQQRIRLMEQERRESVTLHRETVSALEDRIQNLQTELQVQININREVAELNECLTTKTTLYRSILHSCPLYTDGLKIEIQVLEDPFFKQRCSTIHAMLFTQDNAPRHTSSGEY